MITFYKKINVRKHTEKELSKVNRLKAGIAKKEIFIRGEGAQSKWLDNQMKKTFNSLNGFE